jgi:hypothetical protein
MCGQNSLKNLIEVDIPARHNGALRKVGAKAINGPKLVQNGCQILNVLLNRGHKHGFMVRIEGRPQNGSTPPKILKKPMPGSTL